MTEDPDPLLDLRERVRALDERPVVEHPDELEEVHRRLVAELDELANQRQRDRDPDAEPPGEPPHPA
ncbi:hypothetical protein ER308_19755 [Egibacter rhizosphaerae]|uniref:Histidine kinase n=1 Tax=Egibacter rhizosphaerae TaxID=1670831 RepID=A0A411YK51_9ACTN|nr:hypothetical protein [Egibacter rhizosphaerae]QBI21582.1 hypothetical protein ER308_19755 [Egibacter rhizosphaerae]